MRPPRNKAGQGRIKGFSLGGMVSFQPGWNDISMRIHLIAEGVLTNVVYEFFMFEWV